MLEKYSSRIRVCALIILETFLPAANQFMCETHTEWGRKCINSTVVNIFFNNEQSIENGNIRKNEVKAFKQNHHVAYFCGVKDSWRKAVKCSEKDLSFLLLEILFYRFLFVPVRSVSPIFHKRLFL